MEIFYLGIRAFAFIEKKIHLTIFGLVAGFTVYAKPDNIHGVQTDIVSDKVIKYDGWCIEQHFPDFPSILHVTENLNTCGDNFVMRYPVKRYIIERKLIHTTCFCLNLITPENISPVTGMPLNIDVIRSGNGLIMVMRGSSQTGSKYMDKNKHAGDLSWVVADAANAVSSTTDNSTVVSDFYGCGRNRLKREPFDDWIPQCT